MKTAIVIPTYNEAANIEQLLSDILKLDLRFDIIVVDDASPDGTGEKVRDLASGDNRIHLITRTGGKSEGLSRIAGYEYALKSGADFILEMDADFSHNPEYIPGILALAENFDVVIGSRCVPGGRETGRTRFRIFLSRLANFYIRAVYGIEDVFDCTSGFRCFGRNVLKKIRIEKLKAKGPAVIPEILYRIKNEHFRIKEAPIVYEARKKGVSKFNFMKIAESLTLPILLRFGILR